MFDELSTTLTSPFFSCDILLCVSVHMTVPTNSSKTTIWGPSRSFAEPQQRRLMRQLTVLHWISIIYLAFVDVRRDDEPVAPFAAGLPATLALKAATASTFALVSLLTTSIFLSSE